MRVYHFTTCVVLLQRWRCLVFMILHGYGGFHVGCDGHSGCLGIVWNREPTGVRHRCNSSFFYLSWTPQVPYGIVQYHLILLGLFLSGHRVVYLCGMYELLAGSLREESLRGVSCMGFVSRGESILSILCQKCNCTLWQKCKCKCKLPDLSGCGICGLWLWGESPQRVSAGSLLRGVCLSRRVYLFHPLSEV